FASSKEVRLCSAPLETEAPTAPRPLLKTRSPPRAAAHHSTFLSSNLNPHFNYLFTFCCALCCALCALGSSGSWSCSTGLRLHLQLPSPRLFLRLDAHRRIFAAR